jgi:ribonuclease HI
MESVDLDQPLCIRSDSEYLVKGMNEWIQNWDIAKWQESDNRDLFRRLDVLRNQRTAPTVFQYVKAHSGDIGNDMADSLATTIVDAHAAMRYGLLSVHLSS